MFLVNTSWTTSALTVICVGSMPQDFLNEIMTGVTVTFSSNQKRQGKRLCAKKPWKLVPSKRSEILEPKPEPGNGALFIYKVNLEVKGSTVDG